MPPVATTLTDVTVDTLLATLPTTTVTTTMETTTDNSYSAPSTTVSVAIALFIGYPLFMILAVYLCKKYMYSYGPYAGLSYDEVSENMTSVQRAHLISVWCNYKCRLCCYLRVDAASPQDDAPFTISGGVPSSSSTPPPPYDIALSMPRVTAGSVVRFQISDGRVFEFTTDSSTSSSSSTIEPPRFIDDNPASTAATSRSRHYSRQLPPSSSSSSIGFMRFQHHFGPRPSASLPVLPTSMCRSSRPTSSTTGRLSSHGRPDDETTRPAELGVDVESTYRPPTSIVIHVVTANANEQDITRF